MEKTKFTISQSMKNLSKHRLNAYLSMNKGLKNHKVENNKKRLLKPSMKSILQSSYLMNTSQNKNIQNSIYKTAQFTPNDNTAYLSCLSTPKSRSNDRKPYKKKNNPFQAEASTFANKYSKPKNQNQQLNIQRIKITFILNQKFAFQKYFQINQTLQSIQKAILKQIKKIDKIKNYYGLVCFYTTSINLGVDKMLRNSHTILNQFKQQGIQQLNLKVLLAKQVPDYASLQFCDFKLLKYLGSGGFSTVYLARCTIDGSLCALKFIKKSSVVTESKYKMLQNQKNILFTIDHPRLVDLYYALESKNYIIFGLQYCPNGNLYQYIQKHKNVTEDQAKFLISQIIEGLASLHSQKILFRDMKLQNILFDQNGNVKITDFGLSKPQINEEDITYSYCGSPEYMAPEMLAKTGHTFQIDHYALGILLYELLFSKSPFFAPKKQEIFYAIMNSEPQFPKVPSVSKQVKSLIKGLLQKNPKYRIGSLKGIQQIMCHPWLRGYSTQNKRSPFLRSLSEQNIQINNSQIKKFNSEFEQDINTILRQKIFFNKSYVNKTLASKVQLETIKFQWNTKNQKVANSLEKLKGKIR